MTNEELIKFGKEQLEIFGEDSRMSEFIRLAIQALEERPIGEWIGSNGVKYTFPNSNNICSNCKEYSAKFYNFCPNCGAYMER